MLYMLVFALLLGFPPPHLTSVKRLPCEHAYFRAVLPDVFPPGSAFVSNCVGGVHTYLAAQDLLEMSVASIALRLRYELNRQSTRDNVEAFIKKLRQS